MDQLDQLMQESVCIELFIMLFSVKQYHTGGRSTGLIAENSIIIRNNPNCPEVRSLGWLFYLMNSTPLVARLLQVRGIAVIGLAVLFIVVFFTDNMLAPSWQYSAGGTNPIEFAGLQVWYPCTKSFPVHSIMHGSSMDAARLSELCHFQFLFDGIFCLYGVKLK